MKIKFTLRGRLLRSLLFSGVGTLFQKLRLDFEGALSTHSMAVEDVKDLKNSFDQNFDTTLTTKTIRQVFKDANYNGKVYITYTYRTNNNPMINAETFSFVNRKGQASAHVFFVLPNTIQDELLFYRSVYAVTAHEVIHITHKHCLIPSALQWALIGFSPILGACSYHFLDTILSKACEIDADLSSSKKFGTSKDLAKYLTEIKKHSKSDESSSHPKTENRVLYLNFFGAFLKSQPEAFLKSEACQMIQTTDSIKRIRR